MSNVICSLCRGDHTCEEHMQAERDMLEMSMQRHPSGQPKHGYVSRGEHTLDCISGTEALGMGCTCITPEKPTPSPEADHAWATIPRDRSGRVTPAPERPASGPSRPAPQWLDMLQGIATATVTAASFVVLAVVVYAWLFDWKMPF